MNIRRHGSQPVEKAFVRREERRRRRHRVRPGTDRCRQYRLGSQGWRTRGWSRPRRLGLGTGVPERKVPSAFT
jgi:hypothetical protein